MTLSLQLLWNYWSIYHETWYVERTSYGVMHIGRKFWSPHFCGSYAPWNLQNIRKSTNNLSFLCQFFINEITASDAGPDIIRSHLLQIRAIQITDLKNEKMFFSLIIIALCKLVWLKLFLRWAMWPIGLLLKKYQKTNGRMDYGNIFRL